MDLSTFLLSMATLVFWGVAAFLSKIATNRIGDKAIFWDLLGYIPPIIIFSLLFFRHKNFFTADRIGIWVAMAAGALGSMAVVAFYVLLTKKDASTAVPLTALYPALAAILAFIFLGEKFTLLKSLAIILASVALVMLSF